MFIAIDFIAEAATAVQVLANSPFSPGSVEVLFVLSDDNELACLFSSKKANDHLQETEESHSRYVFKYYVGADIHQLLAEKSESP